ncbi:leucine-rich repeat flightless-interacting protein 2 isoform X6 [Micropterus salmoides]|uniref:leucine-rich repeat flightless-interacting protein 2 isoform X6 n=1 Tax=Micropterus salmoides TaxID=27706 RepID=UPI0018ED5F2C|nr:leucine-rich repeat flightless-interacting protein 2 isoform X6 [Micropterus salmoides]
MGTQGPGRKRIPNRERLTAEDDALNQVAREMSDDEERMSVGSRGSFRVEERPDRDFLDKGSRTASTLSAATLASLGGASSRRGSCDTSFSVETEASIRDMKDSLAESEEKYRKAMVSNAQLHNEKSTLMYQVETLREELSDMEELLWESRRQCDDRTKELERERQAHGVLQFQFKEMKETLRQTEELLTAHGVVVSPEVSTNGETGQDGAEDDVSAESVAQLAQDASHGGRESMLELRLKKLFEERESLQDQVRLLKSQLDRTEKNGTDEVQNAEGSGLENGMDSHLLDLQRDANRQISDLKFKLVKSEQEVTTLEQNVIRLEGQVTRYKSASENAEKIEDELKVEKRRLQRELRSALDRIEELEASNNHLSKRLEKMKANRNALLAQQ